MEALKICLLTSEYPPNIVSGPGRYTENLAIGLRDKGYRVTVVTPLTNGSKEYEELNGIEVYRIKIPRSSTLEKIIPNILDRRVFFGIKAKNFLTKERVDEYDLIHVTNFTESFVLTNEIFKKIPTVVSVNEYYYLKSTWNILKFPYKTMDLPLRYLQHNILRQINTRVLNKATKILANSKYTAKAIESCGIPEDKIQTVYRGINTKKFDVKPTEDKYTNHSILFVGGNMERKGGKYLIQAAPSILRDFPDSTFILIGRTSWMYRQLLNRYIKKYNLRKKAKILDYVAPNELRHFYARANVFVMPAIVEALGQVFMEAMMSKTPVIGSNVGGIPENISDGETGFLVKPKDPTDIKDKVFKVFEDPTMAKKMGEMGHRRVLRLFSLEKMINETIRVYQDAITIFKGNLR